jgi:hypothetical protein
MDYSVEHVSNETYKVTITSNTEQEKNLLEGPISEYKKLSINTFIRP